MNEKQTCNYAFFPGCKLGAANPQHVLKSYDYLLGKYNAGIILNCCGAPAYWAGEKKRLDAHLDDIKKSWNALGRPKLIFACAYCEKMFREFLPEIEQVSLYALLAEDDNLTPSRPFNEATVFDPCAARDDKEMEEGVRKLAEKSGAGLTELKEPNRCCGFGGHMRLANPELYEEITANRAGAGDLPYIVYCANCREIFKLKGKKCAHILDMVFSLDPDTPVPSLHEKKENTLEVKKDIMKKLSGEDFAPRSQAWDSLELVIPGKLLEEMDRRLIVSDDLKEAIWQAEKTGDKFVDEADGISQCSMVKSALTYWVQYRELSPGKYEVLDAYSHRMRFSRED
ncbi:Cysteine-rich domain-containing protein [Sporobacter termitidis DSM 10068]|uniref:Cysteine-rich domain-containing protein n=1 Tax=Sporobacter termitidis DSM 10068 TaxID=1123282 RepID=A0A1M5ZAY9_9FIRM|nr:(Fe-S)-binding protein [Sporobacter termitidis]SHI21390.1 Cysteine-rich domain-containing protein [Sporobacter termitidis DSM 10068]